MTFTFPELQRPQYPSSPEVLLSALAWSVVPRSPGTEGTGLIYERRKSSGSTRVAIQQTKPRGGDLEAFRSSLMQAGLSDLSGGLSLAAAAAIANSMSGVPPLKGVGSASSAVGLSGALLQDSVGGLAVANPPNFAHLLNTMYVLGGGTDRTAAECWFGAAKFHSGEGRLAAIDPAFAATTLAQFIELDGAWPPSHPEPAPRSIPGDVPDWWTRQILEPGIGTPFSWFRSSWDKLCSPDWYERLTPRRWASWAICILRQALGFSFLWEANFYVQLAKGVLDPQLEPDMAARYSIVPTRPLLPVQRGSIAQMDVQPSIKRLLSIGTACRKAMHSVCEPGADAQDLAGFIAKLREELTGTRRDPLRAALTGEGDTGGLPNLHETVRYSLLARSGVDEVDNYGLLKVVSRNYTHVAPGQEWIFVMSAMASIGPTHPLRLGDVLQSLKALGFQPRIDFLLAELERAGLCASAADGDEGIEINLGFGGS